MPLKASTNVIWISVILLAGWANPLPAQTPVRIATWNIQAVGSTGSLEYNQALAILKRVKPDVVALNEIANSADVANLHNLAAAAGFDHVIVPAAGGPFGALRNALLSRLPVIQQTVHTAASLSADPNANDITRLIVQITVEASADAKPLTLFAEHWKSGTGNDDEFRRAVESLRIAQAADELAPDVNTYVIMGDVNEEIDSVPRTPNPFTSLPSGLPISFALGVDLEATLATAGIVNDPFSSLLDPNGPAMSALDALQLDGSDATRPASGRRLDYILISPSLAKLDPLAEVYDSQDETLGGGLPKFDTPPSPPASLEASDHFLVFADITVPAKNDFNNDGTSNLIDLIFFAQQWLASGCVELHDCLGTDLDQNNRVDQSDFVFFAELIVHTAGSLSRNAIGDIYYSVFVSLNQYNVARDMRKFQFNEGYKR